MESEPNMFLYARKLLLFAAFFCLAGLIPFSAAYLHTNDVADSVEPEIEKRALPTLKWDGVCPKRAERCPASFQGSPPLIVVSLDGFRPDYLDRGFSPTLKKIAECGTNARYMYSVFPTKTFPNHFSQVTGLNPSSHGIIDNSMYDPFTRKLFKVGRPEARESFWFEKEPIWVTAEKQGKKTASYFWPGSEILINGSRPSYYKQYNTKVTFEDRVDQVLAWLDLPAISRPQFIAMYVNQPDNAAHWSGVKSKQVNDALAKVDRMISRLFTGLQQRNLINCVNVVIMSDHGMSDVSCKRAVDIRKFINVADTFTVAGPFGRVRPKGRPNTTLVNEIVSQLRCQSPHMRVYRKEQLPVRMHFSEHYRIEPIFLELDDAWTVVSGDDEEICTGAAHGYDNLFPQMRATFIAQGPSFKRNYTTRPFISTELYEMFAELINVKPNPNNGTRGSLHHILTSPRTLRPQAEPETPRTGEVSQIEREYRLRINASNCLCSEKGRQTQETDIPALRDLHLPFGTPYSPEDNSTLRLLYNKDYVTAFDLKYKIPMWSAFTLRGKINITKIDDICWKGDARIPANGTADCGNYQRTIMKRNYILQRPLYSAGFSNSSGSDQASYVTNSIPKSLNYTKILEKPLNQLLAKWVSQSEELNVITGPAFDLSATGIRPPTEKLTRLQKNGQLIAPTHIFIIATWCSAKGMSLKTCKPAKLDAHAFLLPNHPYTNNCEPASSVIAKNVARVVDVENLTGISFYTRLPIYDAIRLRTVMPERAL